MDGEILDDCRVSSILNVIKVIKSRANSMIDLDTRLATRFIHSKSFHIKIPSQKSSERVFSYLYK